MVEFIKTYVQKLGYKADFDVNGLSFTMED